MRFLSLFSGIEAASVAFIPMGWECVAVAEIEKFPSAVLAHRYPDVMNLGDVKGITEEQINKLGHIDIVVFGFPCQDLSVAGKRKGLKNEDGSNTRSGLFYIAMQIVRWSRARWAIAENVPGLLSSNKGLDFASVVGEMCGGEIGLPKNKWQNTGVALGAEGLVEWTILDAQYFGLAQRRRRVFIVRDTGNWAGRSPVLFESESLRGDNPPSREAREEITGTLSARTQGGGGLGTDFDLAGGCIPIQEPGKRTGRSTSDRGCGVGIAAEDEPMYTLQAGAVHGVAHTLKGVGFDASEDGTGRGTPLIPVVSPTITSNYGKQVDSSDTSKGPNVIVGQKWPADVAPTLNAHFGDKQGLEDQHALGGAGLFVSAVAFHPTQDPISSEEVTHGLGCGSSHGQASIAVAFQESQSGCREYDTAGCLRAAGPGHDPVGTRLRLEMSVRRLTPKECERLQGFPDDWTNIPWRNKPTSPDGPRYKAIGNSMAVPCMRWIGRRIHLFGQIPVLEDDQ